MSVCLIKDIKKKRQVKAYIVEEGHILRIWTHSVPSVLRTLGEFVKQKQLFRSNENLFGEC